MNDTPMVVDMKRLPFVHYGLYRILQTAITFSQAEAMLRDGRIDEREFDIYRMQWVWSAIRFSDVGQANSKQNAFARKRGWTALQARIARLHCERNGSPGAIWDGRRCQWHPHPSTVEVNSRGFTSCDRALLCAPSLSVHH